MSTNERTHDLDREYVFHSWSAQADLDLPVIAGGLGTEVWDFEGNRYLDFSSQLVNVNIGHQHPAVVKAIQEQAGTSSPPSAPRPRISRAARRRSASSSKAPDGFAKVFFTNGGADANENAIRMARLHTGRDTVLSTYRSYHGNTGAAIVATGDWRRMPNQYARGHAHFFGPYLYRSEFWATTPEEESERALRHLERVIQSEGPATIAAILLETVPGTAGILVPPPGYLAGVRALCDRYGIILILDEVMCGFGRTGRWFAFEGYDVVPDLITFAKGVNSGYVPVGGVVISDAIAGDLRRARVPRRPHVLWAPAGGGIHRRLDDAMESRGHRRERPPRSAPTRSGPACRARRSGIRSSARSAARACSGRSSSSRPRDARAGGRRRHRAAEEGAARARAAAVHRRQPHPRRSAVRRDRRRGRAGAGDLRRGAHRGGGVET